MKRVLLIHNPYGKFSGEEAMVARIGNLLRGKGFDVREFPCSPSSDEIYSKIKYFFSGIYSTGARKKLRLIISEWRPDVVQVQNLFPSISPSVLWELHKQKIPVVMRLANYRLICPNGLLFSKNSTCLKCVKGSEVHAVIRNCENNIPKSLGYAIRNYVARVSRVFFKTVNVFICQTDFQRQLMVSSGFSAEKLVVLGNPFIPYASPVGLRHRKRVVGYVGRFSVEKGFRLFVELAVSNPRFSFVAVGSGVVDFDLPSNLSIVGALPSRDMADFYDSLGCLVVPSLCFEGFPNVILEASGRGVPVVASRIGGIPEFIADGVNGFLFSPGNLGDLSRKIYYLFSDDDRYDAVSRNAIVGCSARMADDYLRGLVSIYHSLDAKKVEFHGS